MNYLIRVLLVIQGFLLALVIIDNSEIMKQIHHPLLPVLYILAFLIIGLKITRKMYEKQTPN